LARARGRRSLDGRSVATVKETNNMAAVPKIRWRLVKAITIHGII
jgi:hypothetical protein